MSARKLAEIWDVNGDYHLRIEVGAFQRQLGARTLKTAEAVAEFEAVEVLRKIVQDYDAGRVELTTDEHLDPERRQ